MAASMALAGVAGCKAAPPEKIVPYVRPPEEVLPGVPLYFATAMPLSGYAIGLIVESHEGRPTKAEGNPDHPASLGATDVFAQASILTLYDPERAQTVTQSGQINTSDGFITALRPRLDHFHVFFFSIRLPPESTLFPSSALFLSQMVSATLAWLYHP